MVYKAKMPEAWARMEWCREQFGGSGEPDYDKKYNITEGMRWWRRQGYLFFMNEKDYHWFLMRWGA